jgi:phenylpropionate dioxygenase-like ring-hydroxylating dioxygenase large terminal subunit
MSTTSNGRRWTTAYRDLGTAPVPIGPCISLDYFERECEQIFRRVWLNVGRDDEIPEPGDYFVKELAVANSSILIVRGKDGIVRAFHNVCAHRANRVAGACRGNSNGFVCGFHGWAYDLKGQLINVPDEDQFFDLERAEYGLTPVTTDAWEGFRFVNLDPQPAESLKEFLGDLGESLAGYPFDRMASIGSYVADVQANWKVTLDSFQEGYHVPFLHRRSAGRAYSDKSTPTVRALDFRLFQRHRTMSIPGSSMYRPTPVEMIAHKFGASITKVGERASPSSVLPRGLNPTGSPNWVFDMIVFFPTFFLFLFDGTYFAYRFWPVTVDRTVWETTLYYPPAQTAGQRFSQEYAKCSLRDTLMEDGNTLEAVQANLASRARTHFILQDQEVLIRHSHKVIDEIVGA